MQGLLIPFAFNSLRNLFLFNKDSMANPSSIFPICRFLYNKYFNHLVACVSSTLQLFGPEGLEIFALGGVIQTRKGLKPPSWFKESPGSTVGRTSESK